MKINHELHVVKSVDDENVFDVKHVNAFQPIGDTQDGVGAYRNARIDWRVLEQQF